MLKVVIVRTMLQRLYLDNMLQSEEQLLPSFCKRPAFQNLCYYLEYMNHHQNNSFPGRYGLKLLVEYFYRFLNRFGRLFPFSVDQQRLSYRGLPP